MYNAIVFLGLLSYFFIIIFAIRFLLNISSVNKSRYLSFSFLCLISYFLIITLLSTLIFSNDLKGLVYLFFSITTILLIIILIFFRKEIIKNFNYHKTLYGYLSASVGINAGLIFSIICIYLTTSDHVTYLIVTGFSIFSVLLMLLIIFLNRKKIKLSEFKDGYYLTMTVSCFMAILTTVFSTYSAMDFKYVDNYTDPFTTGFYTLQDNYLNLYVIFAYLSNMDEYVFVMLFSKFIEAFFLIQTIAYLSKKFDSKYYKAIALVWYCGLFLYIDLFSFNPFNNMETALLRAGPSSAFITYNILAPYLVCLVAEKTKIFNLFILALVGFSLSLFDIYLVAAVTLVLVYVELKYTSKSLSYRLLGFFVALCFTIYMIEYPNYDIKKIMAILIFLFIFLEFIYLMYSRIASKYLLIMYDGLILYFFVFQILNCHIVDLYISYFEKRPVLIYSIDKPWLKLDDVPVEPLFIFLSSSFIAVLFIGLGVYLISKDKRLNTRRFMTYLIVMFSLFANPMAFRILGTGTLLNSKFDYLIYTRTYMLVGITLIVSYFIAHIYYTKMTRIKPIFRIIIVIILIYTRTFAIGNKLLINPEIKDYNYLNTSYKAFKIQDEDVYNFIQYDFQKSSNFLFVDNKYTPYYERFWPNTSSIGKLEQLHTKADTPVNEVEFITYGVIPKFSNNFQLNANIYLVNEPETILLEGYNYVIIPFIGDDFIKYSTEYYDARGNDELLNNKDGGFNYDYTPLK